MDKNYNTYEMEEEEMLVCNSNAFKRTGEYHEVEDLEENEENKYYLYDNKVVLFLEPDRKGRMSLRYQVVGKDYSRKVVDSTAYDLVNKEEIDEVELLEKVVPEEYYECPKCGKHAGSKKRDDGPKCYHCGYGIEE